MVFLEEEISYEEEDRGYTLGYPGKSAAWFAR
jgi:hypothetical protein